MTIDWFKNENIEKEPLPDGWTSYWMWNVSEARMTIIHHIESKMYIENKSFNQVATEFLEQVKSDSLETFTLEIVRRANARRGLDRLVSKATLYNWYKRYLEAGENWMQLYPRDGVLWRQNESGSEVIQKPLSDDEKDRREERKLIMDFKREVVKWIIVEKNIQGKSYQQIAKNLASGFYDHQHDTKEAQNASTAAYAALKRVHKYEKMQNTEKILSFETLKRWRKEVMADNERWLRAKKVNRIQSRKWKNYPHPPNSVVEIHGKPVSWHTSKGPIFGKSDKRKKLDAKDINYNKAIINIQNSDILKKIFGDI